MCCSALFKLVFSHSCCHSAVLLFCHKFHILLYLSACSNSVASFSIQIPFFSTVLPLLSHPHGQCVMLERLLTVIAHCRGQMWQIMAQSFEPCPLNSVSVSFSVSLSLFISYHMGYAVTEPRPDTSVSFRQIMPSKTM